MHVDVSRDLEHLRALSDDDVVAELSELEHAACQVGAAIVAHLVVIKERSIHLARGYSSIVDYCVQWLGCSRDVAYKRSAAVKVAEVHPVVLESLAAGEMSMSALAVLAPYRDDAELVRKAIGRSKREVQKLVAAQYPDTDWSRVQRVRPVTVGRSALELTVPDALVELIERALDLDSHLDPSRDMAALLERAVGVYVKQREKAKFAIVFSAADAGPATRDAIDALGPEAELEAVVTEALRRVAKPRGYAAPPAAGSTSRAREPKSHWPGSASSAAPRPRSRAITTGF